MGLSLSSLPLLKSSATPPYKNLPKAGFNSYSQATGGTAKSELPTSFGVYLGAGQDRRAGATVELSYPAGKRCAERHVW